MTVEIDRSLRLPESEFFPERQRKTGIAIHHTVCGSARTTVNIWRKDKASDGGPSRVATAYVIDWDGTIFEAFDPAAWAWQFGLAWRDELRLPFERRFISVRRPSHVLHLRQPNGAQPLPLFHRRFPLRHNHQRIRLRH